MFVNSCLVVKTSSRSRQAVLSDVWVLYIITRSTPSGQEGIYGTGSVETMWKQSGNIFSPLSSNPGPRSRIAPTYLDEFLNFGVGAAAYSV